VSELWGQNGYPQIVPNKRWAAVSVFSREGDNIYTDIHPFMDDPTFAFRDVNSSPWFTREQCEVINRPHRRDVWRKEARTYSCDPAAVTARDAAWRLAHRELIFKLRWQQVSAETVIGGWLATKNIDGSVVLSIVGDELRDRLRFKAERRWADADLIRNVVTGGGVDVVDYPDGVMWFFP